MEAKITIQELRKHQLQPQESYYQNHSNQYESDSISGRSTPEPKPIIGKFPNLRVESLAHLVLETIIHCINWAGDRSFKGAVSSSWAPRNHKFFSKYIFRSCLGQSSLWYSTSCCKIDRKNSFVHGSNIFWADSMRHLLFVYARTVAPGSHLSRVWTTLSYPLCKISWSDVPTTSRIQE